MSSHSAHSFPHRILFHSNANLFNSSSPCQTISHPFLATFARIFLNPVLSTKFESVRFSITDLPVFDFANHFRVGRITFSPATFMLRGIVRAIALLIVDGNSHSLATLYPVFPTRIFAPVFS